MNYSAGIIPYRVNDEGEMEFFVGHPGGNHWNNRYLWMFLKGGVEGDENWSQTAVREFEEETGLTLSDEMVNSLIPLGSVLQNSHKTTIAFGLHYPDIDPNSCHSNLADDGSCYEIDSYRWMTYDKLKEVTHKTHLGFYDKLISINNETY